MAQTMSVHTESVRINNQGEEFPTRTTAFNVTSMIFRKGKEAVKVTIGEDGKLVITRIDTLKKEYQVVAKALRKEKERMDRNSGILRNENKWYIYAIAEAFAESDKEFNRDLFLEECGIKV